MSSNNKMIRTNILIRLMIVCVVAITTSELRAQRSIFLKTFVQGDSVMIRWAPSSYDVWLKGNKYGYKLERILLGKNGQVSNVNSVNILHEGVIKPLAEEAWRDVVRRDSTWGAIALQSLYGETFELTSSFRSNITQTYNKVRENESRFGFAMYCADRSLTVANALGVYFLDKRIKTNEKYIYRIYINTLNNDAIDTAYAVVDPKVKTELLKPEKPEVSLYGNQNLLTWNVNSSDYVGFIVERSFDGKKYDPISTDLITPFENKGKMVGFYADSLLVSKKDYYYRLVGVSPFNKKGPYSDSVHFLAVKGIDPPSKIETFEVKDGKVLITWEYSNRLIKGFEIHRSSSAEGKFDVLASNISPLLRQWEDPVPLTSGYYKVVAVSEEGVNAESLESFIQLVDDMPPSIPMNLKGGVDSLGIVRLTWKKNNEKDIMGYNLYRGNSCDGEFSRINSEVINDSSYCDKINIKTLTKNVYYKITSVDTRYNTSAFSNTISLKRPDIIRPSSPILRKAFKEGKAIIILWDKSVSDDVQKYEVYRFNDSYDSLLVKNVLGSELKFEDATGVDSCREKISYGIVAVDSSLNRSVMSNKISIVNGSYLKKTNKILLEGEVNVEIGKPSIKLTWNNESKVFIYKREGDSRFYLFILCENTSEFIDSKIREGVNYEYFIVNGNGGASSTYKVKL